MSLIVWRGALACGIILGAGCFHLIPDGKQLLIDANINYPTLTLFALLIVSVLVLYVLKKIISGIIRVEPHHFHFTWVPCLLTFVLSIHSIVTGIALGMERMLANFMVIFFAIISHKGAAGLALGINVSQSRLSTPTKVILIAIFSTMTPIGILYGNHLLHLLSTERGIMTEALFDVIAAGTFIYIALFESGYNSTDENQAEHPLFYLLCFIFGVAIMAVLAIWL